MNEIVKGVGTPDTPGFTQGSVGNPDRTAVVPFVFPRTLQTVRAVVIDDEPWFVAADVCAVLKHTNTSRALDILDEDEKRVLRRSEGLTSSYPIADLRIQSITVVNSPGLYSLILRSSLPAAREFKRWVTHEVLPSILKTGVYALPQSLPEALRAYANEVEAHDATKRRVAELAPAAASWESLASANGDYSVADAAKILSRDYDIKTGQQRLFTELYRLGWTYRAGDGRWLVKQTAVETGRLSEMPSSHYHPRTGELVLDPPQVRVTVKGVHDLRHVLGAKASAA